MKCSLKGCHMFPDNRFVLTGKDHVHAARKRRQSARRNAAQRPSPGPGPGPAPGLGTALRPARETAPAPGPGPAPPPRARTATPSEPATIARPAAAIRISSLGYDIIYSRRKVVTSIVSLVRRVLAEFSLISLHPVNVSCVT